MTLRSDLERWLEYVDSDPEDMGGGKYLTPNEVRLILARDADQAPTDDERGIETWTNGPLVLNATGVADDRNGAFRTVVTVQDGWGRVVLDTRKWHRTHGNTDGEDRPQGRLYTSQARAVFESIDVDELARAVDPAVYPYLNRVTGKEWEACVKVATAIKAHLLGGDRG